MGVVQVGKEVNRAPVGRQAGRDAEKKFVAALTPTLKTKPTLNASVGKADQTRCCKL